MIPLDKAQERVLSRCVALEAAELPLLEALRMVTAERVEADEPIPAFDNTAMDGYAVRAADTFPSPAELRVVGTVAAGDNPEVPLLAGQAMQIMTGAPLPPGADAVVMVERTRTSEDGSMVELEVDVPAGNHVRRVGEDLQPGQVLYEAGCVLSPAHLGALSAIGRQSVLVIRRARVGVISTGDELVEDSRPLKPGQVRDANRRSLLALVAEAGAEPVDLGLVRDDAGAVEATLARGVETCDVLVTSGGVSMGAYDLVKEVLRNTGSMDWMQVAIKPAKPLAFGLLEGVPVFGLPGNTVSCMVSFELFARPALRKMMGHSELHRRRVLASTAEPLSRSPDGKVHFARVRWRYRDGCYEVRPVRGQGSHQLSAMANANGLAVLPDGEGVAAGAKVDLIRLSE